MKFLFLLFTLFLIACPGPKPKPPKPTPAPTIEPTPTPVDHTSDFGRVVNKNGRWFQKHRGYFAPQFVMMGEGRTTESGKSIHTIAKNIDSYIKEFIREHGFHGFHIYLGCAWWKPVAYTCRNVSSRKLNQDTFNALKTIITKTYKAGGIVHLWLYGDQQRNRPWAPDPHLQKPLFDKIKKDLYPLKGWTMSFGFDCWEWLTQEEADSMRNYLNDGTIKHLIGARGWNNSTKIYQRMNYVSLELNPSYIHLADKYLGKNKPVFSEDRYRVRSDKDRPKDVTFDETVRLLKYHVDKEIAAIWGNLGKNKPYSGISFPYPEPYKSQMRKILTGK
jgi:hypothetical protein